MMAKMSTSEKLVQFSLSTDQALEVAHNVMKLTPCEWEGCQTMLNSWQALSKVIIIIMKCILYCNSEGATVTLHHPNTTAAGFL